MKYSDMVDILRDEMYKKDLADKEVEFCTRNRLGLKLLSVYENNEDGVYIDIGTNEDSEERNNEATGVQMDEKIILDWGRSGQGQPPNARQIRNILKKIKKEALESNAFNLYGVSDGMLEYLEDHLDPANAVIKAVETGWILIGIDEKTVQAMYDSI